MLDNQKSRSLAAKVVDPIAKGLLKLGLTANHVTVICAIAVTVIVTLTWSQGNFLFGLLLVFPFGAGDLLDGTMARLSGSTSAYGSFLDSVSDRITDAALIGSLLWWSVYTDQPKWSVFCGLVAIATSAVIPYIRAKAESLQIECKVGIMERSERGILIALAVLIAGIYSTAAISYAFALLALLNSITVFQRIAVVAKAFK